MARANAEKAKQDAITSEEQGKADVAKARANEMVEKIKAVTQAEKQFEVSKLNRLQAEEDSKAKLVKKRAEAEANQLLVRAGLTPLERANIDKETAIGVAREMAKLKFPELMVIGSGGQGGKANPFDAIGIESYMNVLDKMRLKKTK